MALDFKKIKSLFVESGEQTEPQSEKVSTPKPATVATDVAPAPAGSYDPTIFDSLFKAIEDHNLPGEDYLEFLSALQAMQNIPLDEKMKIQTVLATLSTKGLTAQKIKESADYYKKVLYEEQKQFYVELNNQINEQVKSKEKNITDLQELNKLKSEQITKLTQEINENQQKVTALQTEAKDQESKIRLAEANFNKTLDYIVAQIDANLNKIN